MNRTNINGPAETNDLVRITSGVFNRIEDLGAGEGAQMNTTFITPNFDNIPLELRELHRWVTWRAEGNLGEKPRKVPYAPDRINTRASSTDPSTWGSFDQSEAAYLEGGRTGVGIVLNGDGLVGVDIDHCVTDGVPSVAAIVFLDSLGAGYIEISPSGTGLRAIGYGEQLEAGVNGAKDGLQAEFYSTGRYLTLTGKTIKTGPLVPLVAFKATAESFRAAPKTKINSKTGALENIPPDERYAALVKAILSGDVYHDSLRDLAAALVATGMVAGAAVNHLRGLMDASHAPHDERWKARRAQIPLLVSSAVQKFDPPGFEGVVAKIGAIRHPLAKFISFDMKPKAVRWVIPGFIGHGVVTIAGAHGVGKTTALLPLAMVAAGLHGASDPLAPVHWRHTVYIVEDVEQAHRILAGLVGFSNLRLDADLVRERLHIVEARRLEPSYVAEVGTVYCKAFTRTVEGVDILPLVVLDTKSAVLELQEENSNSEASAAMAALKQGFAELPVWIVGHVAKPNIGRAEVAGLSMRGGSAWEADANQVLFLVKEADQKRYLVRGKTRFEAQWSELQIDTHCADTVAPDEFGGFETVTMRWGIPTPPTQSRQQVQEQAKEQVQKADAAALRQEIRDAVATAWNLGNPLNRAGVKAKVQRKTAQVVAAMENLLSERWLYEVAVPAKVRAHPSRSTFLVDFTTQEHEALVIDGVLPELKLVIPDSWKKQAIPPVPDIDVQPSDSAGEEA